MPEIKKIPVTSSNIEAIGYDYDEAAKTSPVTATLRVWFKNGTAYDYAKVPQSVFMELEKAKSVGSYFAANIKGKYSFVKVNT